VTFVDDRRVSRVRPYLVTSGRSGTTERLRLESQVLSTSDGRAALDHLRYEYHDVVALCVRPHAVAEVAAHLGLHLGVARVLVADLVAMGCLVVTAHTATRGIDEVRFIERVIHGLSARR
jgi:hypothetical protein